MTALEEILAGIESKKKELDAAHEQLKTFKSELDEGFKRLRYLRLRVLKLVEEGKVSKEIAALIQEAVGG